AAVKTNEAGTVVENRKYVYNESNQLSEAVLCDGKTTRKVQYTYDADGNLTGEYSPTDRSLITYTYTVENRLEAVCTGTAYSQTLQMAAAYDGDGNRVYQLNYNPDKDEDLSDYYCTNNSCDYKGTGIRLQAEGEVSPAERELLSLINASGAVTDSSYELIEYINDVNREYTEVLVEQNINGTLDTAYVYGAAIGIGSDRLSLDRFDSSTGYYLYDPKGSVTGIINEEGQIYQSYRYSVFGEITFGASQYENEYTYNGESYNPNIKSQYLRARYYCVVTADFLTEDSYLGNIREPLTLNRYNYCVGNPVNYADPSGNWVYIDETGEIIDKYKLLDERTKLINGTPNISQIQTFLSALRELGHINADVDFVMNYNYRAGGSFVRRIEEIAEIRNAGYACEIRERLYNIMDMHMSQRGLLALMYWETVNSYSLEKGYLEFVEKSDADTDKGTVVSITNMQELQDAIDRANQKGTKIYLSGVKPHNVGDGSMTSGFGDYLTTDDVKYYEDKGYTMKTKIVKKNGKDKVFVYFGGNVDYIPINVVVEKYMEDIQKMETKIQDNLKKGLEKAGRGNEVLLYSQRQFDALIIARYQLGSLGDKAQGLILNKESDPELWKEALREIGVEEKRISWEIDMIMFGNGAYWGNGAGFTPLEGIYVEGVTNE
ncbi:MAG: hypothetical protein K2J60_16465, partial [Acetatifactor sp.]|nr:hypothetical protein [Acetatifactor sp.]